MTYKFLIRDVEGKVRTVKIEAEFPDLAKIELFKKYAPMVVYGNHFIFGIYGVVAEYPTANRNIPFFGQD
jgi:hypothetical protein